MPSKKKITDQVKNSLRFAPKSLHWCLDSSEDFRPRSTSQTFSSNLCLWCCWFSCI